MPTAAITQGTATPPPTAPRPRASDTKQQQPDYMKLIVAQMRNLNPMDSSGGQDGLATMMQAESLNQLTALNKALAQTQLVGQSTLASSLLGRTVSGIDEAGAAVSAGVKGVRMDAAGPVLELASGKLLRLADLSRVDAT